MICVTHLLDYLRSLAILVTILLVGIVSGCNTAVLPLPANSDNPTLRIGLLTPTGGELTPMGRKVRSGIIMAFDKWNNQGGVAGHRLEWVGYPTDCTFETAQQAMQQAIADGIQFIIGPVCSEAAVAAAEQVGLASVLMIAPAATHPLVTVDNQGNTRPTVFRAGYSYDWQGQAAAQFAQNILDVDKVAILFNPNDSYTTALAEAFAREFKKQGRIVYEAAYIPGSTDLTEILEAVDKTGAELIYLPANASMANQVAHQLSELDEAGLLSETKMVLLGSDAWESDVLDLTATEGSYFPVHFSSGNEHESPPDWPIQNWVESYKSTYAIAPTTPAALGYDSANMLVEAIKAADSFNPDQVKKILEQNSFEGITGPITFDSYHNPLKPIPFLYISDEGSRYFATVEP